MGDPLDPWQTLWGFWSWAHGANAGVSPFFSTLLWWPDGMPMWFQSWDLPSTIAAWALQAVVSPIAVYNLLILASFVLSGWTFNLLCRELWGGRLGPFLAGCLYTFSTWHFAHAQMQLHLASMQWSPLFLLGLSRTIRLGRKRDVALAGLGLSLAFMASIYHLVFCSIAAVVLVASGALGDRQTLFSRRLILPAAGILGIFALVAGWLLVGIAWSYGSGAFIGQHDAVRFSADLQSFFVPNAVSRWSDWFPVVKEWSGTDWETAAYIGYVALGLAVAAAWRVPRARGYLVVAAVGAILALGPRLHIGGSVYPGLMLPAAWLDRLVPILSFSGIPSRFSWLTTFGVAVAAGASLSALCRAGSKGRVAAVAVTVLALVEVWPRPFMMTTAWPRPAILSTWARDAGDWAVLDGTLWSRALWNQMAHGHPIVAGYATRIPERQWRKVKDNPVLAQFFGSPLGSYRPADVPAATARQTLRALKIRFVIVDETQTAISSAMGLDERYRGEGIVIYEVPAGDGTEGA